MNLAQLDLGPLTPLAPLLLLVGAMTIRLWGRFAPSSSGKPVAVLAASLSAAVAFAAFAWQQSAGATRLLVGPDWLNVPGRVPVAVDISFQIDSLNLFWLVMVTGLGAATLALNDGNNRGQLAWQLLALAGGQLILLTDNLVVLFAFWELTQVAMWRLSDRERTGDGRDASSMLLRALGTDVPLLAAVVVAWQNFGPLHISSLTSPETIAGLSANQQAAIVLLGFCIFAAAYTRCLQFPFGTPFLREAAGGGRAARTCLVTVIVPTGLYLLFRFQACLSLELGPLTLMVGVGSLSALLWGGMAVTQPTLARSVVSFLAGTVGLVLVGIGCDELTPSLLLSASIISGSWAIVQFGDDGDKAALPAATFRAAAVVAVVLSAGILGQEAIVSAAWSPPDLPAGSSLIEAADLSSSEPAAATPADSLIGPVVPVVIMLAHLLLSLALFRGLFRCRLETGEATAADPVGDSVSPRTTRITIYVVLLTGVAAGPLLTAIVLRNGMRLPLAAPGVTGILMILALLVAFVLYSSRSAWPGRIENACGSLASLSRRSFYADELIEHMWVLPWTVLGRLAAAGDRTFLPRMSRRLCDVQAAIRGSLRASPADTVLAASVLTLTLGAAAMIILLNRG